MPKAIAVLRVMKAGRSGEIAALELCSGSAASHMTLLSQLWATDPFTHGASLHAADTVLKAGRSWGWRGARRNKMQPQPYGASNLVAAINILKTSNRKRGRAA